MYFPVIRNNNCNRWLDNAFNELFDVDWTPRHMAAAPAINVKESDSAFTMEVAAPGLKREHCSVNINNEGNLVVKIESKTEHEEKSPEGEDKKFHYVRREFTSATYERTYILPEEVDKDAISAKVEDGILTIELPKVAPEPEKKMDRTIDIA